MDNQDQHLSSPRSNNSHDTSSLRPRSLSTQSRSWPLLPTIQIINSNEDDPTRYSIRSPVIDEAASERSVSTESSESSISTEYSLSDKRESEVYEVMEDKSKDIDDYDVNTRRGTLKDNTRNSADTLVEAALDQVEARDRHVRFPDHIAEAGTLVQRMLSTRYPNDVASPALSTPHTIDEGPIDEHEDIELQTSASPTTSKSYNSGSGSVLASLMKLEAQKRQAPVKRKKTTKKKVAISIIVPFSTKKKLYYYSLPQKFESQQPCIT